MSWTTALSRWPDLLHQLCADFSQLEMSALRRFRGDRKKLNAYLADAHHLTLREAAETLDDWLAFRAVQAAERAAA